MKKNKNKKLYYLLGGMAVVLIAGIALFSQGQLFRGFSALCTTVNYTRWTPDPCAYGTTQKRSVSSVSPLGCMLGRVQLSRACPTTPPPSSIQPTIMITAPAQDAKIDYTTSNPSFSWMNSGFTPNSSGSFTVDFGCANDTYPAYDHGGQTLAVPWDKTSYVMTDSSKGYLTAKLDKSKPGYCYWRSYYYSDSALTKLMAQSPVNHFTFQPPAVQDVCANNKLTVSLSPNQAQGGDVKGGTLGVSLGKWNFSASENLMLKDLTFTTVNAATINKVKLYINGTTPVGDYAGYISNTNGVVLVKNLGVTLPAGVITVIEAKADINQPSTDGVSRPQPGDGVGLKLTSIDSVVNLNGVNVTCATKNDASNLWGPMYVMRSSIVPVHTMLKMQTSAVPAPFPNTSLPTNWPRLRMLAMNIITSPLGGGAMFNSANGNHLDIQLRGVDNSGGAPFKCYLTDGITDYATSSGGVGLRSFTFDLHALAMAPGQTKDLFVDCDINAVNFTTDNDNVSACASPSSNFISWGDSVTNNYTGQGTSVLSSEFCGFSLINPS